MATARELKEKGYLMEVYRELEFMKKRLQILREDLMRTYGIDDKSFRVHDRHLIELVEYIDWKLQVLEKGTPFDWAAAGEVVENIVSVTPADIDPDRDFSGGYLGG